MKAKIQDASRNYDTLSEEIQQIKKDMTQNEHEISLAQKREEELMQRSLVLSSFENRSREIANMVKEYTKQIANVVTQVRQAKQTPKQQEPLLLGVQLICDSMKQKIYDDAIQDLGKTATAQTSKQQPLRVEDDIEMKDGNATVEQSTAVVHQFTMNEALQSRISVCKFDIKKSYQRSN